MNRAKLSPKDISKSVISSLDLTPELGRDISVRSITVSVIGAASQKHSLHETRLDRDIRRNLGVT